MFVKLLGLVDLLAAVGILLLNLNMFKTFALIMGLLVLFKSIIFLDLFMTSMDVLVFLFIILAYFGVFNFFTWIVLIWLIYKGIISLI
jgi:hypothetical protein